jgi:hypothetical protein
MKIIKIGIQLLGMITWGLLSLFFIRTIRRFLLIRWGSLNSTRIGHFAANTELYFCEKDLGINVPKQKTIDFFLFLLRKK